MDENRFFIAHYDKLGRERVYHLKDTLLVGRSSDCHIVIDSDGVSRSHCSFNLVEAKVVLRDLESTNGTFLNSSRIREAIVRPGDKTVVGAFTLYLLSSDTDQMDRAAHPPLLGQTPIGTVLEPHREAVPDAISLRDAGLGEDALLALFKLSEIVNSAQERESLLKSSVSLLMDLFDMDLGCVYRVIEDSDSIEKAFVLNNSGCDRYHPSSSVLNQVIKENVSLIAADVIENEELTKFQSIAEPGTASIMCVPIRSFNQVNGAIYLSSLRGRAPWKEGALQLLVAMATQIGLSLANLENIDRLKRDNLALRLSLENETEIIGSSNAIKEINRLIDKVAATDATVLILGESGTGKELIANAIHNRSKRRERPMVSINCGAIPDSTVESELFGHEKGAFTGADTVRPGKFEIATEGTLFLDEIGEVPLMTQVKLLRALEQKSFYHVGGDKLIKVDVRIMAATNSDLHEKVQNGEFREDLLHRLKVFVIQAPPLRDRPEDIPELVDHFLDQFSNDKRFRLSSEGKKRIMSYFWPGNVRELKNVLEREVILADGDELSLGSMDPYIPKDGAAIGVKTSLKDAERAHIIRVLNSTGWNKKAAAEILGIGRPTIYDKIKQFNIKDGE